MESEEEEGGEGKWMSIPARGRNEGATKRTREDGGIEGRVVRRKVVEDEYKVVMKFKDGHDIQAVSLITLTTALNKVGEVELAQVLHDGRLLIKCKDVGQRDKAMRLTTISKKEVYEVKRFGAVRKVRGVISGIPLGEKLEELKKNIKGGKIEDIKRLQMVREGQKVDSTSILLEFQEETLPAKVMIGYMCFTVREYVPPPMRCYKCQRYGHIAKFCKGKQMCGKCGGDHEYDKCESDVKKI